MSSEYKSMPDEMEQKGLNSVEKILDVIRITCGTLIVIETNRGEFENDNNN